MKKIAVLSVCILMLSFALTACGGGSEKDRFVAASIDVGCAIFDNPDFFSDMAAMEEKTMEIFGKYGFDVSDEAAMTVIAEKYQYEEDVIKAVQEGITECAGDLFGGMMNQ